MRSLLNFNYGSIYIKIIIINDEISITKFNVNKNINTFLRVIISNSNLFISSSILFISNTIY